MTVFKVEPDWQPMDTAPKDGQTIIILSASAGFMEDTVTTAYRACRWDVLTAYKEVINERYDDGQAKWVLAGGDGNSYIDEQEWTVEHHFHTDHGVEREINIYRGTTLVAWAYPWAVEPQLPPINLPFRQTVIFDKRDTK